MRTGSIVLGLAAVAFSTHATAEPEWSTVGAGCVPTGQTIRGDVHFNTGGRTKFADGKIGEIILTCPITKEFNDAARIRMSYADSDGAGAGASVLAALRRVNITTGHTESIELRNDRNDPSPLNSDLHGATSWSTISRYIEFGLNGIPYRFDFANYYYYVQVNLRRTSLSQAASFGGVVIE